MTWTVTFYSEKVESQTLALPAGILANLLHTLELIEGFVPSLGRPHSFIKKTRKIPKKHMALARKRMKEVTDND